jgi:hypothetical protein
MKVAIAESHGVVIEADRSSAYPYAKESSCEPQNYVSWLLNPLTHSQSLRIPDLAALLVSLAARFMPFLGLSH